jgi:hypothetical protein
MDEGWDGGLSTALCRSCCPLAFVSLFGVNEGEWDGMEEGHEQIHIYERTAVLHHVKLPLPSVDLPQPKVVPCLHLTCRMRNKVHGLWLAWRGMARAAAA